MFKKIIKFFKRKYKLRKFNKNKFLFNYKDVIKSAKAKKYKINNHPTTCEQLHNILETNERFSDLIMDLLKQFNKKLKDVNINSWFRSPKLNLKVKGSKTSDHKEGKAIDFWIKGIQSKEICIYIHKKYYAYDQLILYPTFIHISFDSIPFLERNENRIKTKDGFKKVNKFG